MASPPPVPDQKPFVLCVEDDPDLLRMIARVLSTITDVQTAGDGKEALGILQTSSRLPSLIVSDVMMPRMDGLELAAELKKDPRLARIPLIMLTAKGGALDVISGINAGARHYLTKPFKHDELLSKVKKILGKK